MSTKSRLVTVTVITLGLGSLAASCGEATPSGPQIDGDGSTKRNDSPSFAPAPHLPFPQIQKNDGVLLSGMKLVTIVPSNDPAPDPLFSYSDAIGATTWWSVVSQEYGVSAPTSSIHVIGPPLTIVYTTHASQINYINSAIAGNADAAPDGNTLYLLYYPVGLGEPTTCRTGSGGFHAVFDASGDTFAVLSRCQALTWTPIASHEIFEAATDPGLGNGYDYHGADSDPWSGTPWALADGEIGDFCEGTGAVHEAGFAFDRMWSNAAAVAGTAPCIPASINPYYSVSPSADWYPLPAGSTVTVPLTGWSEAPIGDWGIRADLVARHGNGSGAGFTLTLASDSGATMEWRGKSYARINNGQTASLTMTVSSDVAAGKWAFVKIYSFGSADGADESNFRPIGFYVPTFPQ